MARTRKFNLDEAIKRALRESIEAHAREWEPDFEAGVGPVGDDAPFDDKVNESEDKEGCCPKCGKCGDECTCECDEMNEGTIPSDSREWEPGFETGVGEVGDDSPFTQAVNESMLDTNDWEEGSFGAEQPKKEGIAYADGGDECGNGDVATSQKNSGEVVSKDNLSEEADEESDENTDELFGGLRRLAGKGAQAVGNAVGNAAKKVGNAVGNAYNTVKQEYQQGQAIDKQNKAKKQAWDLYQKAQAANKAYKDFIAQHPDAKPEQTRADGGAFGGTQMAQKQNVVNGTYQPAMAAESVEMSEDNIIKEEQDRFFSIMGRIEKLYD